MKQKYLLGVIASLLLINTSLLLLVFWHKDNQKNDYLQQVLKIEAQEKPVENNSSLLFNPPLNLDDSYYQYIDVPYLSVDLNSLINQNADTVAWLEVGGTNVDYPVVQTHDNQYYLTHSFDKSNNQAGWVFSDFRNNLLALNKNSIIYGHGRRNNKMFGGLKVMLEDEYLNNPENQYIKLTTTKEQMIWQVFSVYVIPKESYYITTHFAQNEDWLEFLKTIKNRSIHDFQTEINENDLILTLSTCQDENDNRLVVHARCIKKETIN